ncbi:MAG: hypothetical protein KGZ90_13570, partial [Algoriphagus sp.]|nr:hypothetical protein [Algoriphagus sp.]
KLFFPLQDQINLRSYIPGINPQSPSSHLYPRCRSRRLGVQISAFLCSQQVIFLKKPQKQVNALIMMEKKCVHQKMNFGKRKYHRFFSIDLLIEDFNT